MTKSLFILTWALIFAINILVRLVLVNWYPELHVFRNAQLIGSAAVSFFITAFIWFGRSDEHQN